MSEKIQDFRGLSALLLGNQAERPGKHLQRTSAVSLATLIPHCCMGLGSILSKMLWQWNEKAKGESVRNNTVQSQS